MCAGQFEVMFIHLQCLPMCVDQEKNIIVHSTGDVLRIYPKPEMAMSYIIVDERWRWLSRDKNAKSLRLVLSRLPFKSGVSDI